jgi:hypothetical protein
MNEVIFAALYLFTSLFGLLGFIIVPILSLWIGLWFAEFFLSFIPVVGHLFAKVPHMLRHFLQKWLILWPLGKLWKLGGKLFGAAGRGFVIVMKWFGGAAWRGACRLGNATRSRLRGTP